MKNDFFKLGLVLMTLVVAGCASVPLDYPKEPSYAIQDNTGSEEAGDAIDWMDGREDVNGFYPLSKGLDAFGARLALMDAAQISIDAQYFLMKPDNAGLVFAGKLMEAADRGVRVRLLLDDIFTEVDDFDLAMIDNHPNIELRVFNPISRKGVYAFNYVGTFKLANRRMHNKSFTIDNAITIVGGRNIAVEYFQLETTGEFLDFDILGVGPIVDEVSASFDDYWNHELAVPMAALYKTKKPEKFEKKQAELKAQMADAGESIYADAINTPLMQQFFAQSIDPYIAEARLIVDEPQKLLEEIGEEHQVVVQDVRETLDQAEREVIIFTPYFIPRERGIEFIQGLTARGVRVVVVTNSLATNNHTAVHSAYANYRKALLEAGVELWEARADAAKITAPDGTTELDRLTLHAKGILIDRERVFAGSLNLDPRSIDINTEMGVLVESPDLAALMMDNSYEQIPTMAYRLQLNDKNKITWHATIDGEEVVETKEPQTSAWRRFSAWFQKIAPEDQL